MVVSRSSLMPTLQLNHGCWLLSFQQSSSSLLWSSCYIIMDLYNGSSANLQSSFTGQWTSLVPKLPWYISQRPLFLLKCWGYRPLLNHLFVKQSRSSSYVHSSTTSPCPKSTKSCAPGLQQLLAVSCRLPQFGINPQALLSSCVMEYTGKFSGFQDALSRDWCNCHCWHSHNPKTHKAYSTQRYLCHRRGSIACYQGRWNDCV